MYNFCVNWSLINRLSKKDNKVNHILMPFKRINFRINQREKVMKKDRDKNYESAPSLECYDKTKYEQR